MRAAADFLLGFLFLSAAAGDGGAQWMDSYLADEPGKTVIPPSRPPVACQTSNYATLNKIKAQKEYVAVF